MQELVNRERCCAGLPPVALDKALCLLSAMKARDMRDNRYFGHRSERLGTMTQMVSQYIGNLPRVGENIGLNFPDEETVHQAWMTSALHRKNILGQNYSRVGYGWADAYGTGRIYVQVFTGEN
jgi:uncharacterized protein YkwD